MKRLCYSIAAIALGSSVVHSSEGDYPPVLITHAQGQACLRIRERVQYIIEDSNRTCWNRNELYERMIQRAKDMPRQPGWRAFSEYEAMKIGSDGARKVWENCCIGKTLEEAVHEAQQASDTYYGGTEIPLEQRNYLLQVLETGGLFNELPSQEVQIAVRISNLMDSVIQVGFMEMEQVKNAINEAAGLIDTAPRNIRWYCIGDIVWLCRSLQNQGGVPPKPQEARQEMAPPQAGAQAGEEARQEMALQQAGVQAEEEDEEAIEPVEEEEDPPQRCNVQ